MTANELSAVCKAFTETNGMPVKLADGAVAHRMTFSGRDPIFQLPRDCFANAQQCGKKFRRADRPTHKIVVHSSSGDVPAQLVVTRYTRGRGDLKYYCLVREEGIPQLLRSGELDESDADEEEETGDEGDDKDDTVSVIPEDNWLANGIFRVHVMVYDPCLATILAPTLSANAGPETCAFLQLLGTGDPFDVPLAEEQLRAIAEFEKRQEAYAAHQVTNDRAFSCGQTLAVASNIVQSNKLEGIPTYSDEETFEVLKDYMSTATDTRRRDVLNAFQIYAEWYPKTSTCFPQFTTASVKRLHDELCQSATYKPFSRGAFRKRMLRLALAGTLYTTFIPTRW